MNFLINKFIRKDADINNPAIRERFGVLSSLIGIVLNIVLSLSKLAVGLIFNSISVVADGINNLTDIGSAVVTLIGFKISSKPADEKHPFGHARMEYISGLIVSFIILILGGELIKTSIDKIIHPDQTEFSLLTVAILIFSVLVKLWMCLFNRKIGKRMGSTAVMATAQDSLNDVVSTSAVLISLLISYFANWNLDGYIGTAVALFIMFSGVMIAKDTLDSLLGEAPKQELLKNIGVVIREEEKVLGMHDLIVHSYGAGRNFASVHAEVSATDDIMQSHDMIDNLEREVFNRLNVQLTIHLDPVETNNEAVKELKEFTTNIVKGIDERLSIHDFRVVIGNTHSNLIFDLEVPNNCKYSNKELVSKIDKNIKLRDETLNVVINIDLSYTITQFGETKN